MSRPYQCDRCGKLGEPRDGGKLPEGWEDMIPPIDDEDPETVDLCPGCVASFQKWWSQPRKIQATIDPGGAVFLEKTEEKEAAPPSPVLESLPDGPTESHLKRFGLNLPPELQPKRREMCQRLYDLLKDGGDLETICETIRNEFDTNGFPSIQTARNWANLWRLRTIGPERTSPLSDVQLKYEPVTSEKPTYTKEEYGFTGSEKKPEFTVQCHSSRGGTRRLM